MTLQSGMLSAPQDGRARASAVRQSPGARAEVKFEVPAVLPIASGERGLPSMRIVLNLSLAVRNLPGILLETVQ